MIHLHAHSCFSLLDGMGTPEAMVLRAKEIGAPALAITDHASISGLTEFLKAAKQHGIKAVPGCEFYWVDDATVMVKGEKRNHLTVWAKNWDGVLSIMSKLTIANAQFYSRPRLSWEQVLDFGPNVMIGTGCGFGVLSRDDWREKVEALKAVYGTQSVYLEIMPHDMPDQERANRRALEASLACDLHMVATNDAHYVRPEDAKPHEVMLAIQTGAAWDDPKRFRFDTETLYLRTQEEMITQFAALPYVTGRDWAGALAAAMRNCQEIADKSNVVMPKFDVNLPSPIDGDDAAQKAVFQQLLVAGWSAKGPFDTSTYMPRLTYEVSVIQNLNFTKYFLVVEDIIRWARAQGIMVGPARGSSAGSLVCYLLGITQIDPMKHGLYFERFLNPERLDLPDIDVDFADDRREEVFNYIRTKYGADYTANINTYGTLSARSAFRDVCRVFGIDIMKVNVLSKKIEDNESFDKDPDLINFGKAHKHIVEHAKALDGVIRSHGVHACGIIVSDKRIDEVSVIERRKEGAECVNWDKRQAEEFGLVKIDILGLATLTVLNRAKELIAARHAVEIDFPKLPLDDAKVLDAFSRGEGIGVFQFENAGMMGLLKNISAHDFDAATHTTALYRPGSLNSGQTEMYVKIYRGDEYESYACEELKPILGNTKGVMVYQEQIMQIFNQLGGFTWAEADKMRKIIGKKLGKDEFEKHRKHFVDGCATNGIAESVAVGLFDKMVEFAAYSFNKSHAVAYTTISFWSMYLKMHYPIEFFAALLSHTNETDRLPVYAKEAARLGITVRPPDVNLSTEQFDILDDTTLIAPIGIVKGIGDKAVQAILTARRDGVIASFLNAEDLYARVNRRVVNVRVVELLRRAGAFDGIGGTEPDPEKRSKDLAELLPYYSTLPTITTGNPLDKVALVSIVSKCQACAAVAGKTVVKPKVFALNAPVMVINNPVKGERDHFTSDGSKFFASTLKGLGVDMKKIYYTSPVKCMFAKQTDVPKECAAKCIDYLREEIKVVKPKLILCFASNAMKMLGADEQMGKYHGQVIYNKEFDAYVMFSYSPQYAYFQDTKTAEFLEAMNKLKEILG